MELSKLYDKLDILDTRLDQIEKDLAVYNQLLEIHIKRTEQNEELIRLAEQKQSTEIEKVQLEVARFRTGIKIFHWLAGAAIACGGLVLGLVRLLA